MSRIGQPRPAAKRPSSTARTSPRRRRRKGSRPRRPRNTASSTPIRPGITARTPNRTIRPSSATIIRSCPCGRSAISRSSNGRKTAQGRRTDRRPASTAARPRATGGPIRKPTLRAFDPSGSQGDGEIALGKGLVDPRHCEDHGMASETTIAKDLREANASESEANPSPAGPSLTGGAATEARREDVARTW